MKILHVLRTIVLTPVGALLTNEAVCEIMQSCFRICFEMRLSELLRKAAEHTLVDMIQLLFSRLPQFRDDVARYGASTKRLKIGDRGGGKGSSALQRKSPRLPSRKQHQQGTSSSPGAMDGNDASSSVSKDEVATSPADSALGESVTTPPKSEKRQEIIATTPVAAPPPDSFGAATSESAEPDAASTERDVDSVLENQSDGTGSLQSSDFVNPRGVRFTAPAGSVSTTSAAAQSGSLIPYGLPCVRELFRFLISLINPNDRHNSDVMTHMGVALVTVALESGVDHIPAFPSLLALVKVRFGFENFILLRWMLLLWLLFAIRCCLS